MSAPLLGFAVANAPERLKALILIGPGVVSAGAEVTELRRKDVSDDASVLSVARGVTHRQGCRIDTPKSGKGRVVVVPPHVRPDIEAHLAEHVGQGPEALLFPASRGGCHLDDKTFRARFTAALKTVGREGVRVHDYDTSQAPRRPASEFDRDNGAVGTFHRQCQPALPAAGVRS